MVNKQGHDYYGPPPPTSGCQGLCCTSILDSKDLITDI